MRRWWRLALAGGLAVATSCSPAPAEASCTWATVTAYSREAFPGVTATGRSVWAGDWAAVHPWSPYAYGTVFTLPDGRSFELQDVGDVHGLMPANWIDILLDGQAEAIDFGRQEMCVEVWR